MELLVIGAVNADLIVRCARIAAPGQTVIATGSGTGAGGKGGNQAAAIARLGGTCHLVGRVGTDADGDRAVADLRVAGVHTDWLHRGTAPTGLAIVLLDERGENAVTVLPGANAQLDPAQVAAAIGALAGRLGVVLASLEVPLDAVIRAALLARAAGLRFVLNPAPARPLPDELLAAVDVLTPNRHEVADLHPDGVAGLLAAGVGAVVVTLGADGCLVHRPAAESVPVAGHPVQAVDSTGAGDAFTGTLAWALAGGHDLDAAVRLANAAGALATRAIGARAGLPDAVAVRELAGLG